MKKFLLIIVILFFPFFNNSLFSQTNWEEYFPRDACMNEIYWTNIHFDFQGPYEKNICIDDLEFQGKISCPNSSNCCYKIIYYEFEHMHTPPHPPESPACFWVYIAAVLWYQGEGCETCDKTRIIELFYEKLLREKIEADINFMNLGEVIDETEGPFQVYIKSPGYCKNDTTQAICDSICCWREYRFKINEDTVLYDFRYTSGPTTIPDSVCYHLPPSPQCSPSCDEYPFREWLESCCDSIEVTPLIDSSCCVKISVYNPYCYAPAPDVVFQQYNPITHTYITAPNGRINCPMGQTVVYTMCPTNGNNYVKYRVKIEDENNPGHPNCDSTFVEGKTMYTDSVDLSTCCSCDSLLKNDWVNVELTSDDPECDSGCKVTVSFDIPDSITCYNYYKVENIDSTQTQSRNMTTDSTYSFCLNKQEFGTIKIYLLRDSLENLNSACKIEKGVACDTVYCCPPYNYQLLYVRVYKDTTDNDSCCRVSMEWTNPGFIPCYHYYLVQDINGNYLNTWDTGNIDTDSISKIRYCISPGDTGTIRVTLYKNYEVWEDSCVIEKFVSCDTTSNYVPPCLPPDCLEDTWEEPQWHSDSLANGCKLYIRYTFRKACIDSFKTWQDLEILDIFSDSNCVGMTQREILDSAIMSLLHDDPMLFIPLLNQDTCSDVWRIGIINCWRFLKESMSSCLDSVCCWQKMEVCRDEFGNITYRPMDTTNMFNPPNGCDTIIDPLLIDPDRCYFICSWLRDSSVVSPNQGIIDPLLNVIDISDENSKFVVKIMNGNFNLSLKINCGELARIDITDVYGLKLISKEMLSKTNNVNMKIDISTFEKGNYLYRIYCNGYYIGYGKFLIE